MPFSTLSSFISSSTAERAGDYWTVYADGENRRGRIEYCEGSNEFEAKEDAWGFINLVIEEFKKQETK